MTKTLHVVAIDCEGHSFEIETSNFIQVLSKIHIKGN